MDWIIGGGIRELKKDKDFFPFFFMIYCFWWIFDVLLSVLSLDFVLVAPISSSYVYNLIDLLF